MSDHDTGIYALAVYAADQLPPIDTAPVGAPIEEAAS